MASKKTTKTTKRMAEAAYDRDLSEGVASLDRMFAAEKEAQEAKKDSQPGRPRDSFGRPLSLEESGYDPCQDMPVRHETEEEYAVRVHGSMEAMRKHDAAMEAERLAGDMEF